jgi:hypothetical protein
MLFVRKDENRDFFCTKILTTLVNHVIFALTILVNMLEMIRSQFQNASHFLNWLQNVALAFCKSLSG